MPCAAGRCSAVDTIREQGNVYLSGGPTFEDGLSGPGIYVGRRCGCGLLDAAEAYQFVARDAIIKNMDLVRKFSFEHGILRQGAGSPDAVGIQFPAGKMLGDPRNIKMRFDPGYKMTMARPSPPTFP